MAKGKCPCDNCGKKHYTPDCPHFFDEAKINNAKEEHTACRGGGRRGGRCGGGRQGDRNKWRNYDKDGDRNYYGNGVQKIGNAWMCYCSPQECGWNTTHTYVFHAAWKRDHGTFVLPDDHDYWKLSGNTAGAATRTGDSEGGGASIPEQRCLDISEVISRYQGEASDASFSAFLTELFKMLGNLK